MISLVGFKAGDKMTVTMKPLRSNARPKVIQGRYIESNATQIWLDQRPSAGTAIIPLRDVVSVSHQR